MKDYYTSIELAERWGVTKQTVAKWVKERGLPCKKLGTKTFRYDKDSVHQWESVQGGALLVINE